MAEQIASLHTQEDLDRLIADAGAQPVVIFKHSTTCPISAAAHLQFRQAVAAGDLVGASVGLVRVIEERPLSLAIAEQFGVQHQSPQALVLRGGRAVWSASHRDITRQALKAALTPAG